MNKTLSQLASMIGADVEGDGDIVVTGVAALDEAGAGDLSFLANSKYEKLLDRTGAAAVVVGPAHRDTGAMPKLVMDNPYLGFARAVCIIRPLTHPGHGVSDCANISEEATLSEDVTVMAGATIEAGAVIGSGSIIYSGAYIGRNAKIGAACVIYPNVTIREECVVGDRVVLQPNCVIGSDGFGYAQGPAGHQKFNQVGNVVIEDDVEVGSGTTIDRGALGSTTIGAGTKIDNLVQVAHNVTVGPHSMILSQVGISGSTKLGTGVVIAGQSGVAGHLEIGDGTVIGGRSGVTGNVGPGVTMSGYPLMEHREWLKAAVHIRHLSKMERRIKELEGKIKALDPKGSD